jgi:tetratricopeptide (TPR) repeat protein
VTLLDLAADSNYNLGNVFIRAAGPARFRVEEAKVCKGHRRMRGIWLISIFVLLPLLASGAPSTTPAAISEADRLFGYGADQANERQALEILERALTADPADYQLLWRVARSYYYVGDGAPQRERVSFFERGIDAGKKASRQYADGVEGHFWLAANWGGVCREKGGIAAFKDVKNVRSEMEMALKLNSSYEEGGAYVALGEIDRQLPKLFGGSVKRAITTLETGLKLAPDSTEIRFALAEAYLDSDRKNDARIQLEESLKLPVSAARAYESRRAQEKARALLSKLPSK